MDNSLKRILETSKKIINRQRIAFALLVAIGFPTCIALWTSDVFALWHKDNPNLWGVVLGILILFQILFAYVLLWREDLTQDTYFRAKELSDQVFELEKEKSRILKTVKYYTIFSNIVHYWLLLEGDFRRKEGSISESNKEFFDDMFAPIIELGEALFSFKYQELWNFSIYVYDPVTNELKSYWRKKHAKHPSLTEGRSWGVGEGHVGTAFARRKAIITSDATIEEVIDLSSAPDGLKNTYDFDAYQSFAAIPIMRDGEKPVGILVATSNIPQRYNKFNSQILNTAAVFLYNFLIK